MTPPPPGNAISSGLVITLGADFSPSGGLPAGVMATGVLGSQRQACSPSYFPDSGTGATNDPRRTQLAPAPRAQLTRSCCRFEPS